MSSQITFDSTRKVIIQPIKLGENKELRFEVQDAQGNVYLTCNYIQAAIDYATIMYRFANRTADYISLAMNFIERDCEIKQAFSEQPNRLSLDEIFDPDRPVRSIN